MFLLLRSHLFASRVLCTSPQPCLPAPDGPHMTALCREAVLAKGLPRQFAFATLLISVF